MTFRSPCFISPPQRDRIPPAAVDNQFFHAVYYEELKPEQKKRNDDRTWDWLVYYGD